MYPKPLVSCVCDVCDTFITKTDLFREKICFLGSWLHLMLDKRTHTIRPVLVLINKNEFENKVSCIAVYCVAFPWRLYKVKIIYSFKMKLKTRTTHTWAAPRTEKKKQKRTTHAGIQFPSPVQKSPPPLPLSKLKIISSDEYWLQKHIYVGTINQIFP